MTAKELLELLRNETNTALLRDIIMVSLGSMQPAYREDTIYMADLKYLHQGPIYVAEDVTYKTKYYVAYTNKLININNKFENIIKTNEIIDIGWFNIEKLHYLDWDCWNI